MQSELRKWNHVKLGEDLAQERPTVIVTDNWMEAKATAPLYEWKPSSPITFAAAVIHFYKNHRAR